MYEVQTRYICENCGEDTGNLQFQFYEHPIAPSGQTDQIPLTKKKHVMLTTSHGQRKMISIQYQGIYRTDKNVIFPMGEGNIQDGSVVDKHGDADLVAEIAKTYLDNHKTLMQNRKFPISLSQVMPAIQLLVIAAELAMKAFLIRAENQAGLGHHSLTKLYGALDLLDGEHGKCIESYFSRTETVSQISDLGEKGPTVKDILQIYDSTYGGQSNVYKDMKYYGEPTTMFNAKDSMRGESLVKAHTPYPIFLPQVVKCMLQAYEYSSGPARLRRLAGDIRQGEGEDGTGSHGDWGLIPQTLALVIISIPQKQHMGPQSQELDAYRRFFDKNPPLYCADWHYGGSKNLFYPSEENEHSDGITEIDGIECEIWLARRIRLHARDLYFLADVLEKSIGPPPKQHRPVYGE